MKAKAKALKEQKRSGCMCEAGLGEGSFKEVFVFANISIT
jgi:hypothetical protein